MINCEIKTYEKAFPIYVTLQNYLNEFDNSYTLFEKKYYERLIGEDKDEYFFRIIDYMKINEICQKLCSDYRGELKTESYFIILKYHDERDSDEKLFTFVVTKFYFESNFSFSIVLNLLGLTSNYIQNKIKELKENLKIEKINKIISTYDNLKNMNISNNFSDEYDSLISLSPINPFFILGNLLFKNEVQEKIKKNKEMCNFILKQKYNKTFDVSSHFRQGLEEILTINISSPSTYINFDLEYYFNKKQLDYDYLDFIFNDDLDIRTFLKTVLNFNINRKYLKMFKFIPQSSEDYNFEFINHFRHLSYDDKIDQEEIKNKIKSRSEYVASIVRINVEQNENVISDVQQDIKFLKYATRNGVLKNDIIPKFQKYLLRKLFQNMGLHDLYLTEKNIENFLTKLTFKYENIEIKHKVLFSNL